MTRTANKRPAKSDAFPSAELRRARMLAYLDASRDDFKRRLETVSRSGIKTDGLLAGPSAKNER